MKLLFRKYLLHILTKDNKFVISISNIKKNFLLLKPQIKTRVFSFRGREYGTVGQEFAFHAADPCNDHEIPYGLLILLGVIHEVRARSQHNAQLSVDPTLLQ